MSRHSTNPDDGLRPVRPHRLSQEQRKLRSVRRAFVGGIIAVAIGGSLLVMMIVLIATNSPAMEFLNGTTVRATGRYASTHHSNSLTGSVFAVGIIGTLYGVGCIAVSRYQLWRTAPAV